VAVDCHSAASGGACAKQDHNAGLEPRHVEQRQVGLDKQADGAI
jgi:hypothetical protein